MLIIKNRSVARGSLRDPPLYGQVILYTSVRVTSQPRLRETRPLPSKLSHETPLRSRHSYFFGSIALDRPGTI